MLDSILAVSFMWGLFAAVWIVAAVILILLILLQKGRGAGLGGAFGGGAAGGVLGTKTGDFFTWLTIILVAAFLVIAITLGITGKSSDAPEVSAPAAPIEASTEVPAEPEVDTEAPAVPDVPAIPTVDSNS